MKYIYKALLHLLPVILFFVFLTLFGQETWSTVFLIIIFISYLYFTGFKKREVSLFIFGLLVGLLVEVYLGSVNRQQFWFNASFLGVPVWLPLAWGMGFVVIRRVGDIIILHRKNIV